MNSIAEPIDLQVEIVDVATEVEKQQRTARRHSRVWRRVVREPLVHFLFAGVVLFAAATLIQRFGNGSAAANRIQVSAAEIQRLQEVWTRQWGHAPDSTQTQNLINDYIRDEVMYREALASGLDKEDTIIRRRLVEKMEFLSQELASADPSEQDLQAYFQQNREKFRVPAQMAFTHIYFSTAKRGSNAEGDAARALAKLRIARTSADAVSGVGDAFMLQNHYPLQTQQQIMELFGEEFARELFQAEPGAWYGPIRSSYGFHLVQALQTLPSRVPELAEVRSEVRTDFKNQRLQIASERFYGQLRKRYRVDIDKAALATARSQPQQDSHASHAASQAAGADAGDVD